MAGESILIIDDNLINLQLLQDLLVLEGYTTRTSTSHTEAFDVLNHFEPRMILMDIRMPGMDGLTLTKQLKADPKYRDTIILAVSALAKKHDMKNALAAGCHGYITKPIDIDELPKVIRQFLDKPV
jgi:CheY-like chemotaxis protein